MSIGARIASLVSTIAKGKATAHHQSAAARFVHFCERQKPPQVHLALLEDGDNSVFLVRFVVSEGARRNGIGSTFFSVIAEEADKEGISIVLNADPDPDSGMDVNQLASFYAQHGFEPYWQYEGKWAEAYDGKRDGSWLRMGRFPKCVKSNPSDEVIAVMKPPMPTR